MTFKICTKCGHRWESRDRFLEDDSVRLVGYQIDCSRQGPGFFLFNHLADHCGTTLALDVNLLENLYDGPVMEDTEEEDVEMAVACLYTQSGLPCPESCECRFVNVLCEMIMSWPKRHRAKEEPGRPNPPGKRGAIAS